MQLSQQTAQRLLKILLDSYQDIAIIRRENCLFMSHIGKERMPTPEHTINDALAATLRTTRYAWRDSEIVRSENTGMLRGSNERPDILVLEPNVSPVVIETELMPALKVESEARSRLGKNLGQG